MDTKVEYIIKNYQYFELDEAQKELIVHWAENSDEFEALQNTLLATDHFVESQKEDLNPTIKQRLDVRFAEKHDQTRLVWYNKLWLFLWPGESAFYKRPLIQFAAICLIVAITIPFFPDISQQQLAMNDVKMNDEERTEESEQTKQEEESLPEEADKTSLIEEKEIAEEESNLSDNKSVETLSEDESVSTTNQEGWRLNEERSLAGVESRLENSKDALDDVSNIAEDQEETNSYIDKSDMDVLVLEQDRMNRQAKDAEVPKKVETKETLDLLTALY